MLDIFDFIRRGRFKMPYIDPKVTLQAKKIDLQAYLPTNEPTVSKE
jgi:hypothetical protein